MQLRSVPHLKRGQQLQRQHVVVADAVQGGRMGVRRHPLRGRRRRQGPCFTPLACR